MSRTKLAQREEEIAVMLVLFNRMMYGDRYATRRETRVALDDPLANFTPWENEAITKVARLCVVGESEGIKEQKRRARKAGKQLGRSKAGQE